MSVARVGTLGVLMVCVVAMCGCGHHGSGNGPSARLHQHAITAGNVMTRSRGPLPARAAALSVAGRGVDDTIDALAATGTTWDGSVTLRITVADQNGAFGSSESATSCFRYRFTYPRASDWGAPHRVDCGNAASLDLTNPPLPQGINAATRQSVRNAVRRLSPAQQSAAGTLASSIRAVLGPFYTVQAGSQGSGAFVWVRYGDGCLSVDTSAAKVQISQPIEGLACFGG